MVYFIFEFGGSLRSIGKAMREKSGGEIVAKRCTRRIHSLVATILRRFFSWGRTELYS